MATVAVFGAGGPAGYNFAQAARQAGHYCIGFDDDPEHLPWALDGCQEAYPGDALALAQMIGGRDDIRIEELIVHAQPERLVLELAGVPGPWRSLLPSPVTIKRTQAKAAAIELWADAGLRDYAVALEEPWPDWLHIAANRFGLPFWLRASRGAGARGATLVENIETGYHWIRYWSSRGVDWTWLAEEYLPGREFCWTAIYQDGLLLAAFLRERLEWLFPHLSPSGRTGTPTIARVVVDPDVVAVAKAAVAAVDGRPNGVYCVDLVEGSDRRARPTEINAGRFATSSPLYAELGPPNLVDVYLRAAAGLEVEPFGDDVYPEGATLRRHLDIGRVWT